jgi:hypothetical protein
MVLKDTRGKLVEIWGNDDGVWVQKDGETILDLDWKGARKFFRAFGSQIGAEILRIADEGPSEF